MKEEHQQQQGRVQDNIERGAGDDRADGVNDEPDTHEPENDLPALDRIVRVDMLRDQIDRRPDSSGKTANDGGEQAVSVAL